MLFDRSIPISKEDALVHTDHDPFCCDPMCPCHEDPDLLTVVAEHVEDGLMTPAEATRFTQGRQL
jgi:hypothetical protein